MSKPTQKKTPLRVKGQAHIYPISDEERRKKAKLAAELRKGKLAKAG